MPKTVWDLLSDCLEELEDDQFKKFTTKLINSGHGIKTAAVRGKDRGDVASKLVDTFTEQRAPGVTVNLLKDLDYNQVAMNLEKAAAANGYSVSAEAGGSGAVGTPSGGGFGAATPSGGGFGAATPSGGFSEADFIDENYSDLVERATGVEAILDALLSKKIINNSQYSEITTKGNSQKMMSYLIREPLKASGKFGKKALYEVLMKQQYYMMKDLGAP